MISCTVEILQKILILLLKIQLLTQNVIKILTSKIRKKIKIHSDSGRKYLHFKTWGMKTPVKL